MTPRKTAVEQSKGVFEVEWPMFGELSRALALRVVRDYDPEVVIGVATAGVVPGAVIAAIMDREFHSIIVSRRYHSDSIRETPAVFGAAKLRTFETWYSTTTRARAQFNSSHARDEVVSFVREQFTVGGKLPAPAA